MPHKQEGNQQATKAKLVTRAPTQAQCMKCKYKLVLRGMQTIEKNDEYKVDTVILS